MAARTALLQVQNQDIDLSQMLQRAPEATSSWAVRSCRALFNGFSRIFLLSHVGCGLPSLTMPFILACWLIRVSRGVLRRATIDCAP